MSNKPTYDVLEQRVKELEQKAVKSEQTEDELRIRDEHFGRLVTNSSELIYQTDQTGKIAFISQSVKKLIGYTADEAIGMHMANEIYLDPSERDRLFSELRQNGQVQDFEVQLKRKDSSVWWGSANSYILEDDEGNMVGVEGLIRDVTKRKQMGESLVKEKRKLADVISGTNAGTWEWNVQSGDCIQRALGRDYRLYIGRDFTRFYRYVDYIYPS